MTRIPIELVHQVCQLLRFRELLVVRFISPEFAAVALTHLMSTVSFVLAPISIQRLENLSKHPVCSKLVKTVEYEMSILRDFTDIDEAFRYFEPSADVREGLASMDIKSPSRETVADVWASYESVRNYQRSLRNPNKRRRILRPILACFPNLRSLRCVKKGVSRSSNSAFGILRSSHFPTCRVGEAFGAEQLEDVLRIAAQNHLLVIQFQPTSKHEISTRSQVGSHVQARLTSLTVQTVQWPFLVKLSKSENMMQSCEIALQHLLILDLRVPLVNADMNDMRFPPWQAPIQGKIKRGDALHTFLALAPKLTSLFLNFKPDFGCNLSNREILHTCCLGATELLITHAIGLLTWSNLRHLYLGRIKMTSEELLQTLERHAGTLKSLHLEWVFLLSGSCRHVVNEIVDVLALDKLCFGKVFKAEREGILRRCNATIQIAKKKEFLISWPKFGKTRLGSLEVRITLGDNQLGRILFEEEGDASDAPAQCMKW